MDEIAGARWLDLRPKLIVVTRGGDGLNRLFEAIPSGNARKR